MKKIFASVLFVSCLFAFCSCNRVQQKKDPSELIATTILHTVLSDPERKAGEVYTYIPIDPKEVLSTEGLEVFTVYYNQTEKIDQFLTPDRSKRVKTFYYDKNGDIRSISIELYSGDSVSSLVEYDPSGKLLKVSYCSVSDKDTGLPLLKYNYDSKGVLTDYVKFEYSEDGNPLRDSFYLPDDTYTGCTKYEYGEDGYTEYKYDAENILTGYTFYTYSKDSINYTKTEYDANGKIINS